MPFTAEELEEMRRVDEEIEREFHWTNEELQAARERDREARLDGMDGRERKEAAAKRAYYEANREKVAASQRWLREERKERGYTQWEVAKRIGTTQPEIALLESGRLKLESFGKKDELCALLGR